ncbi:hypothetical protein THIOKS11600014 [Thiocapsa sp. KS1]|nr:hypothetical protein THIOKS11600014 [Thiocapsa sp. KS1]
MRDTAERCHEPLRVWVAGLLSEALRPYSIITLTDALAAVLGSVGGATVRASISA